MMNEHQNSPSETAVTNFPCATATGVVGEQSDFWVCFAKKKSINVLLLSPQNVAHYCFTASQNFPCFD